MGDYRPTTRREMLALLGGTVLAGRATGGVSARTEDVQQTRAYVGSYHWGYFLLDADGAERDQLTLTPGEELRITAVNVESDAAIDALPSQVRAGIPSSDERARRNEESIPVPQDVNLEDLHEAAENSYPDHSLAVAADEFLRRRPAGGQGPGGGQGGGRGPGDGVQGGHHGPVHRGGTGGPGVGGHHGPWAVETLAPPTYLWHHATVPSEIGFVVEDTGSFGFACTVYCGYGHPYMTEPGRVVVSE